MTGLAAAKDLMGVGRIPGSKPACLAWLKRHNIAPIRVGAAFLFPVCNLPEQERQSLLSTEIATMGLPQGTYDEAAHADFAALPATMRTGAQRKADIARVLVSAGKGLSWADKAALITRQFGDDGASKASLMRIAKAVEGVDPINFAPALVAAYRLDGPPPAPMSDGAWSFFMTTLRDAGEGFPLIQAWRDVRDVKAQMGWDWPSFPTVFRRWQSLPVAQQLHARIGHAETVKRLAQPALRDKTTILPLEWVSLDGRRLDFWLHTGDGKPRRFTFLALVDCATNYVLGWEITEHENARSTARLIKRTCQTYGIFDRLYTDNGSAFAGHLVAGGAIHRFRYPDQKMGGVKPLGICHHLGIRLHFALPANGQAKTAERTFASLSRVIDDRPEFKGAHAGHAPGAAPDARVMPVHLDLAREVLTREVHRYNAETGRRGQGMRGRSYQDAFTAGMALRMRRQPSARQLYLAGLIYTPVKVDRWGRATIDTWTYGDADTQEALLPYHKSGQHILLGRDPDDFSAPALAWNSDNRLICEGIMPVARGAYGSVDGIRDAARNRKAMNVAVKAAAAANDCYANAEFKAVLAAIPTPDGPALPPEAVVKGRFNGALRLHKAKPTAKTAPAVPAEYLKNMDAHLADIAAGRKPKLA